MKNNNRQKQLNLEPENKEQLVSGSRFSCFYVMEVYKSQHINISPHQHLTTSTSQHITTSLHQRRSVPAPSV